MKFLLILIIKFYRYFINPLIGNNCRFYPTCSIYAQEVLIKYNIFYSIYLILKRIFRCNHFFCGGNDPVP